MSRHGARDCLFQLEILTFNHRHNGHIKDGLVTDGKSKVKIPDLASSGEIITKVKRANNPERAKVWAARFGSVISCHKVDTSRYYTSIEFLDLKQEPLEIPIDREEYELSKDLEISRHSFNGQKFVIDKSQ